MPTALEDEINSIGIDKLPSSLGDSRRAIIEIFAKQICDGHDRFADPYFTNDRGHNIGKDVLLAATAAARQLEGLPDEPFASVITRIIERVEFAKTEFMADHSDPDGYGAATFGEIVGKLRMFSNQYRSGQ